MNTAINKEEEKKEYFDTPEELDAKVDGLAQLINASKHFVAFTGAGISTSAGIPDYRSGANTCLPTGAGCWEKAANIDKARKEGKLYNPPTKVNFRETIQRSQPTLCHMAMVELMKQDKLKHIISQNIDGLHRKSGVPADKISELHGNTNLEYCQKCGKGYMRDFRVRTAQKAKDHKTGRKCDDPSCRGILEDSIINFGENLREDILNEGYGHGFKADVMLAMGSSMRVCPANEMAGACTQSKKGFLVIVNLQKTPMDKDATLVIHAKIDHVMKLLMKKLKLQIPEFKLERYANIEIQKSKTGKETLKVYGVDYLGGPYDLFKKVSINGQGVRGINLHQDHKKFDIELHFQGHYNEHNLSFSIPRSLIDSANGNLKIKMVFNPNSYITTAKVEKRISVWETVQSLTQENKQLGDIEFSTAPNNAKGTPSAVQQVTKQFGNLSASTKSQSSRRSSMSPKYMQNKKVMPLKSNIKKPQVKKPINGS